MDWHSRYLQQAKWTRDLRTYVFEQAGLHNTSHVLEVGCGTGAVLSEISGPASLCGLDIDRASLAQCRAHASAATLVQGNALQLPYIDKTFDIVYCHFLLLWVKDPRQALREMKRIAKAGAAVIAFAEPDYSARIDEPRALIPLGHWQTEALQRQGADPGLGARLADLFHQAGIPIVETGTIQSTDREPSAEEWEMEWAVIESDLAGFVPAADLQKMKKLNQQARTRGERVLRVPTYFAWGRI